MKQVIINWLKLNFNSCLNENETILDQKAEKLEDLILTFMEEKLEEKLGNNAEELKDYPDEMDDYLANRACDRQHELAERDCGAR